MPARKTPSLGSKPDRIIRNALMVAAHRECLDENGKKTTYLNRIATMVIMKAVEGDAQAYRELFDRIEGKSKQEIDVEHSGELTLKSVVISQLDSFFAVAAGRLEDQSDADVVSN